MEFNYVTYDQLNDLEYSHPLVTSLFDKDTFHFYTSNPDKTPDFPLLFYIKENGKVVSYIRVIPDKVIDKNGNIHQWAWTGGLKTDPQFRGKGYATELVRQTLKVLCEKQLPRGSVYSAPETLHIYSKVGGVVAGFVRRYLLLKTIRPVLGRYIGCGYLLQLVDSVYRYTYLSLVSLVLRIGPSYKDFEIITLSQNDLKDFNQMIKHNNICSFNSGIEKLLWKISMAKNRQELFFVSDEGRNIIGYFVIRRKSNSVDSNKKYSNYNLMTLMDYGCYIDDMNFFTNILFHKVLFMFLKSESDVLEIIASSTTMISSAKKHLFIKAGRGMSFTFSMLPRGDIEYDLAPDGWLFTSFCGDAFTYK